MSKVVEVRLINEKTATKFNDNVNAALKEGFEYGGVEYGPDNSFITMLHKYDVKNNKKKVQ